MRGHEGPGARRILRAGEITEIVGPLSSGRTSLLVACLREVTQGGALAALIDTAEVFDPRLAADAGVDLARLLWVRGGGRLSTALHAADLLARCPGFGLVALDLGEAPPRVPLPLAFRLRLAARRSGSALLILAGRRVAGASAALALRTVRRRLEWAGPAACPTRLACAESRVAIVRARGAAAERHDPAAFGWSA
jgi:hypothetical protein